MKMKSLILISALILLAGCKQDRYYSIRFQDRVEECSYISSWDCSDGGFWIKNCKSGAEYHCIFYPLEIKPIGIIP